jgi:hypothetical protein
VAKEHNSNNYIDPHLYSFIDSKIAMSYRSKNNKTNQTRILIGDAISNDVSMPSLRRRFRMQERISELVAHGSDPILDLCPACSRLLSSAIEKEYACYQHQIAKYVNEDFSYKEDVNVFEILSLAQSEEELREQIVAANQDLSNLTETHLDMTEHIQRTQVEIEDLQHTYSNLLIDTNILESKRSVAGDKLLELESLTCTAERELRMLHTLETIPLFYISFLGHIPVINGLSLSLYPTRSDTTHYAEINAAWGLVGLAISSLIGLHFSSDSTLLCPDMFYKLTPLRNRVILRRIKFMKTKNSEEPSAYLGPVLSLEGGVSETYLVAIAALLVVMASVARKLNSLDALKGVMRRVLDTVDKYGADVAGATYGGSFTTTPHSRGDSRGGSPDKVELLPHWRYLFASGAETVNDLLESLQRLLG